MFLHNYLGVTFTQRTIEMASITMTIEQFDQLLVTIGALRGKRLTEQVENIQRVIHSDSVNVDDIMKLCETKTKKTRKSKVEKPVISDDSEFESENDSKIEKNEIQVEDQVPIEVQTDVKPKKTRSPKEQVDMEIIESLNDDDWESLTCDEGKSNKFWRAITVGTKLFVHYGKVGSKGIYQQKTFESDEDANKQLLKDIALKQKKGYSN